MDRRSWLWRRKSSEKSPGETESLGSVSSLSERFSDDQAYATHSSQSPEITSKDIGVDDEVTADVKTLTEKLSTALLSITAKEELVKQHAKVAEEAVSGWEKAEKEVLTLKQQLEAAARKNSALEDRVSHLDGALKECVRQLRQAREDQDQKIQEAINKKSQDLEIIKSELEIQVAELQAQLESAKTEATAAVHDDLGPELEALEKENSALKLKLLSQDDELEIRTIERDLSIQAAEIASKQHLESIKKLTKLEAECRRLKAVAKRSTPSKDHKSSDTVSSNYIESFTDNQSENAERQMVIENDALKMHSLEMNECEPGPSEKIIGRTLTSSSIEINLMDDFLEMERLAALQDSQVGCRYMETGKGSDNLNARVLQLEKELEMSNNRMTELEEKVEMAEVEKLQLEMDLMGSKKQMEALQKQLKETEGKLSDLKKIEAGKVKLEMAMAECQKQLQELHGKLNKAEGNLSELEKIKAEKQELTICLATKQKQLETSQNEVKEAEGRLIALQTQLVLATDRKEMAEEEANAANKKSEAAETRLRDVETEVKTLLVKIASLEEVAEKERALSAQHLGKCQELQDEILKFRDEVERKNELELPHMNRFNGDFKMKQEKELALAANKFAECQRTIASLGQQLKSLASLEDFFFDSEEPLDLHTQDLYHPIDGGNQQNSNPSELNLSKRNSESLNTTRDLSSSLKNANDEELPFPLTPVISSERSQNGLLKFLNKNNNGRQI